MIIRRSIRGRIASTSMPECFAYSGFKSSQRLCLVTDRFQTLEEPGSSSSGQSIFRYSFPACTHPVHPPTFHYARITEAPGGSLENPPRISRLISNLSGRSSPPCTP
ncbi:hypothetical protein CHARACLAT_016773 [Characodon lateralis]|uniref:Uncharacterized protein n=1 Tax=Characodon lateralis TaxID=208331 RepID=A0ABU7DHR2_9TELE|nr:hypothetical protein [Characodon lateralis]